MKHALMLPPFGQLSDPAVLVDIAVAAEASGWDALFLWDHVLRGPHERPEIADPWIAMAAIAVATGRIRIGPMVTPITRRRPIKLAREAVTLDHLSGGRLTLGLGLGVDTSRELSGLGEIVDPRVRGERLDEGVDVLTRMWSGDPVSFHGRHFTADDVTVLPRPVQQPRIPLWFAARGGARKPVRRASRFDGLFPIEVDEHGLGAMLDVVRAERGSLEGFDVAVQPSGSAQYRAFAEVGMTWAIAAIGPHDTHAAEVADTPPVDHFDVGARGSSG